MSDEPAFYGHLTFNAPLSDSRADGIATRAAAAAPATVLDVDCGWVSPSIERHVLPLTASAVEVMAAQPWMSAAASHGVPPRFRVAVPRRGVRRHGPNPSHERTLSPW